MEFPDFFQHLLVAVVFVTRAVWHLQTLWFLQLSFWPGLAEIVSREQQGVKGHGSVWGENIQLSLIRIVKFLPPATLLGWQSSWEGK